MGKKTNQNKNTKIVATIGYGESNDPTKPTRSSTSGSLAISENNRSATFGFFSGTISASKRDKQIVDCIDEIPIKIMSQYNNLYQLSLNYDEKKDKLKWTEFLNSEYMQEKIKFLEQHSVLILMDNDNFEPELDKIYFIKKFDSEELLEKFGIKFKGEYNGTNFCMDFKDVSEQIQHIKKFNLTVYDNIEGVISDITQVSEKLHKSTNTERISLLKQYNEKYDNQLQFTYILDYDKRNGTCKVQDIGGKIIFNHSSTIARDKDNHDLSDNLVMSHTN